MTRVNQRVKFLDVGHGDSAVVYLYNNYTEIENVIIVDIADSDKLLAELNHNRIKVIDLIVISHSDADHCRGVNDFLEKYLTTGIVRNICFNLDRRKPTKTMRLFLKKFIEIYKKEGIVLKAGQNDTEIQKKELFSNTYSKLFLLYPNVAEATEAYLSNDVNNTSIVCLLDNNACKILFSGDLEERGWNRLLERMPDLKCDIIKMPHHGAFYDGEKGIGLRDVLDVLQPENAIVSSGDNQQYKHPEKNTIDLLNELDIKTYCTEITNLCHHEPDCFKKKCCGDIEIIVGDNAYKIRTETKNMAMLDRAACQKHKFN